MTYRQRSPSFARRALRIVVVLLRKIRRKAAGAGQSGQLCQKILLAAVAENDLNWCIRGSPRGRGFIQNHAFAIKMSVDDRHGVIVHASLTGANLN